jgi:hypothetical protein
MSQTPVAKKTHHASETFSDSFANFFATLASSQTARKGAGRMPEKTKAGKNRGPKECASVFVRGVYHIRWPIASPNFVLRKRLPTNMMSIHHNSLTPAPYSPPPLSSLAKSALDSSPLVIGTWSLVICIFPDPRPLAPVPVSRIHPPG